MAKGCTDPIDRLSGYIIFKIFNLGAGFAPGKTIVGEKECEYSVTSLNEICHLLTFFGEDRLGIWSMDQKPRLCKFPDGF
jgi:hypothetical protein